MAWTVHREGNPPDLGPGSPLEMRPHAERYTTHEGIHDASATVTPSDQIPGKENVQTAVRQPASLYPPVTGLSGDGGLSRTAVGGSRREGLMQDEMR